MVFANLALLSFAKLKPICGLSAFGLVFPSVLKCSLCVINIKYQCCDLCRLTAVLTALVAKCYWIAFGIGFDPSHCLWWENLYNLFWVCIFQQPECFIQIRQVKKKQILPPNHKMLFVQLQVVNFCPNIKFDAFL